MNGKKYKLVANLIPLVQTPTHQLKIYMCVCMSLYEK